MHPFGSPFLVQHLFEWPRTLLSWERRALARAAAESGEVVALDCDQPVPLVLRISRSDPSTTRSLRHPLDEMLTVRTPGR